VSEGVILSKGAFAKVSETVKAVLGEPTLGTGERTGFTGARNVVVQVSGPITGQQGRYDGKILVKPKPDATGELGADDFGEQGGDAVVWYPADIGESDPQLDNGVYVGFLIGWDKAKAVVVVAGGATDCTPDGTTTNIDVVTGVTWNVGGNGKLQFTKVTLSINSCGDIGPGSPVTVDIDTPEAC
jgi:hypothetical protein